MVEVVAAILYNQKGELLICRRPLGKNCALLWEFPGGKREAGESDEEALLRECREELAVEIGIEGFFDEVTYRYPEIHVHIRFYIGRILSGSPKRKEHKAICWVSPAALSSYSFCPADEPVIERLQKRGSS